MSVAMLEACQKLDKFWSQHEQINGFNKDVWDQSEKLLSPEQLSDLEGLPGFTETYELFVDVNMIRPAESAFRSCAESAYLPSVQ